MDYKIYNVIYDINQEKNCEFIPLFNPVSKIEEKSYLFEWNPIISVMDKPKESEYIGIFSWKFGLKTGMFCKKINHLIDTNKSAEVYTFCRSLAHIGNKYYDFSNKYHPGLLEVLRVLCKELQLPINEPKHIVYSNFVLVKWEIYKDFIETIIKPAIALLEDDYEHLAWKNANYRDGLQFEELKKYTELDFYPMHTFVLERLWSAYLEKNNYSVLNLADIKL